MQHQDALPFHAFDRDETHGRPCHGLADRLRVGRIDQMQNDNRFLRSREPRNAVLPSRSCSLAVTSTCGLACKMGPYTHTLVWESIHPYERRLLARDIGPRGR